MIINPRIVEPKLEVLASSQIHSIRSDFSQSLEYLNKLGREIIVLDRRGFEYRIKPKPYTQETELKLTIYETLVMKENVTLTFSDKESDEQIIEYRKNVLEAITQDKLHERVTRKSLVATTITANDLKQNRGAIYIKEHDIVIFYPNYDGVVVHPATVSKIINGYEFLERDISEFRFSIKINDPNNRIGNRYINISGIIHELVPNRDAGLVEGVIISSSSAKTQGEYTHVPMSIDDFLVKVKTYTTVEDAQHYGNLEEIEKQTRTKELETLKHNNAVQQEHGKLNTIVGQTELDQMKKDLAITQTTLKEQELRHKQELERLAYVADVEKHQRELESLRNKSYYEERSLDRKDSSELIKFLPFILGAGLALLFK